MKLRSIIAYETEIVAEDEQKAEDAAQLEFHHDGELVDWQATVKEITSRGGE